MQGLNVVLAQDNPQNAQKLIDSLHKELHSVFVTRSGEQVRRAIAKHRPDLAIVDLETVELSEVEKLHSEFGDLCIVCTHRLADEELWAAALAAGANDCCLPSDVNSILLAANRKQQRAQSQAA
jgi:DNA-binding response OmpR family regulator